MPIDAPESDLSRSRSRRNASDALPGAVLREKLAPQDQDRDLVRNHVLPTGRIMVTTLVQGSDPVHTEVLHTASNGVQQPEAQLQLVKKVSPRRRAPRPPPAQGVSSQSVAAVLPGQVHPPSTPSGIAGPSTSPGSDYGSRLRSGSPSSPQQQQQQQHQQEYGHLKLHIPPGAHGEDVSTGTSTAWGAPLNAGSLAMDSNMPLIPAQSGVSSPFAEKQPTEVALVRGQQAHHLPMPVPASLSMSPSVRKAPDRVLHTREGIVVMPAQPPPIPGMKHSGSSIESTPIPPGGSGPLKADGGRVDE